MNPRQLRSYVEALLRGRRPSGFTADDDATAVIRTAITLRAARPGSGAPSEEFLAGLHQRLAAEIGTGVPGAADPGGTDRATSASGVGGARGMPMDRTHPTTRRQIIQVASAAASVAVGAAGGIAADRAMTPSASPLATPRGPAGGPEVDPNTGTWQRVTTTAELPEGAVHAFDLGTVTGFVRRVGGRLQAVSGICTHRQCRLALDGPANELTCPCHRAAFTLAGEVVRHQFKVAPAPLPRLTVRESDGSVEIYAP
jgi:cytochrome b6-f complex iron-sulfur subunit